MNILVTNDDGINSGGLKALVQTISKKHNVYIVAPDRERSAMSQSLTLRDKIYVKEVESNFGAIRAWTTSGTPTDCVKLAISTLLNKNEQPELVISGINHGPNLGFDIRYSGTVGAAIEASMLGINAIAVSLVALKSSYEDCKFSAKFTSEFIDKFKGYTPKNVLNINIPNIPEEEIKGIEITQTAGRIFTTDYKQIESNCYQLDGVLAYDTQTKNTDLNAIRNKKISITPICYDMVNDNIISKLNNIMIKQIL